MEETKPEIKSRKLRTTKSGSVTQITIPKSCMEAANMTSNDTVAIYCEPNTIILKKMAPVGDLNGQ